MIPVDQAIRRVKRDVMLSWAMHLGLALAVMLAMLLGAMVDVTPILLAAIPCTLWIIMAVNGMRETRTAMQWPGLIASGRLDEAEREIERTIRQFTVLRTVKLLSLHQLAVVKMAKHQWVEALQLSTAILRHRLPKDQSLQKASLLVAAGAAVQSGHMFDAYVAMNRLRCMALTLDEQLSLLSAEAAYCGRQGEWNTLASNLAEKSRLAEILPTELSVQVQGWLALAARHTGQSQWADFLKHRCELLANPGELCAREAAFATLWPTEQAIQEGAR